MNNFKIDQQNIKIKLKFRVSQSSNLLSGIKAKAKTTLSTILLLTTDTSTLSTKFAQVDFIILKFRKTNEQGIYQHLQQQRQQTAT